MRRANRKKSDYLPFDVEGTRVRAAELWAAGYPPIVSRRAFSLLLGVSPRLIPRMMSVPSIYWRVFPIRKRSGGTRTIQTPRAFLKTIQLYILQNILSKMEVSPEAFGFSKGKGSFAHASVHVQRRYVVNIDIQDFFPSISYVQVSSIFGRCGFTDEVVQMLTALCTLRGELPQGAPTSPRLADLVFAEADLLLRQIASENEAIYTRYADDLTFSSDRRPSPRLVTGVVRALEICGFKLNHEKTRITGPGEARRVTGFVVNAKVHPDRKTRRELRSKFHNLSIRTQIDIAEVNEAQGWASYINSYNQPLGRICLEIVRQARVKVGPPIALTPPDSAEG